MTVVRAWRGHVLRAELTGEVRDLRERPERTPWGPENEMWTVLSFRLERFDEEGNRIMPIPVELRGHGGRRTVTPAGRGSPAATTSDASSAGTGCEISSPAPPPSKARLTASTAKREACSPPDRTPAMAGFKIVASGMRQCLAADGDAPVTEEQMEKMFLTLA